ncbi:MAG TPA: hypothetical protein VKZ79_25405 [Alphaproteobacteria bacterium]|nr:hypothetical protein [Alphaproteobacteria bacterium]
MATIYYLDQKVGPGEATGFIQTDGALGVLSSGNITNWNILLNDGNTTFDLLGYSNSQILVIGNGLTATSTNLFFDFSGANSTVTQFQNPALGSGINFLCFDGPLGGCSGSRDVALGTTGPHLSVPETGNLAIASTTPPVVAMEPASVTIFGIGLLAVGILRRRSPRWN